MGRWERALVTGASSGIGGAFSRLLADEGVSLVVVARDEGRLESLAGDVAVDVEVLAADLGSAEGMSEVAHRLETGDDPVDLLVNNAGFGITGPFADNDVVAQQSVVDVNVSALLQLTHAAARAFGARGGGSILNVASIAAYTASPNSAVYAASKAFVHSFSQSVHEELSGSGVNLTCLSPGFTRTEFQDRAGYEASELPDMIWQTPEAVARAGLDAMAKGSAVCIPGVHNKAFAGGAKVAPSVLQRKLASLLGR